MFPCIFRCYIVFIAHSSATQISIRAKRDGGTLHMRYAICYMAQRPMMHFAHQGPSELPQICPNNIRRGRRSRRLTFSLFYWSNSATVPPLPIAHMCVRSARLYTCASMKCTFRLCNESNGKLIYTKRTYVGCECSRPNTSSSSVS